VSSNLLTPGGSGRIEIPPDMFSIADEVIE